MANISKNKKLNEAKFLCYSRFPYFSHVLFNLVPIELPAEQMPTMAVDARMRLYYSVDFIEKTPQEELVGSLIHEINHIIRGHLQRFLGDHYDHDIANIAQDCEINDDITKENNCNVKLPDFVAYPNKFKDEKGKPLPDNKMAEWYYEELKKQAKPKVMSFISQPGGCGSVTGQKGQSYEEGSGSGENQDKSSGHSKEMIDFFVKSVADDVTKISQRGEGRGNVPGYLERWAKEFLRSKIDWKKELAVSVRNAFNIIRSGMVDYTWTKMSRRQSALGKIVLPGFCSPLPSVGLFIDTSGSVNDTMLAQAVAETQKVLSVIGTEIIFCSVDHAVYSLGKLKKGSKIPVQGGGGTDMCLGYEAMRTYKGGCPSLIICITDGDTGWPEEALPHTKNIIVLTQQTSCPTPKWAKIIQAIPDKE